MTEPRSLDLSLELYRRIFAHTDEAVAIIDPKGVYVEQNAAHRALVGYPDEELRGMTPAIHLGEETFAGITRELGEKGAFRGEVTSRTRDGRVRTLEISAFTVRNEAGEVLCHVGFKRDITESKHSEAALRRGGERLAGQQSALVALTRGEALRADDLDAALRQLTEMSARTLGVERVSVWRYNRERTAIRCVDLFELGKAAHSSGAELVAASYPAYFRVLEGSDVIAADDARRDPRTSEFTDGYLVPLGITSMMDAPVFLEGRLDGVLCHEHIGPSRPWTTDEKTFSIAIANLVSLALGQWERQRAARRMAAQHAATRILAESNALPEAAIRILGAVCESLRWETGALWTVDHTAEVLRCIEIWHKPSRSLPEFEKFSRRANFAPGVGLPGRVWASRHLVWNPDVARDPDSPRASIAAKEGLHAAFGFPVVIGDEVFGVIEFFSREILEPDAELLAMMGSIGTQIGQFVERRRAEEALRESEERWRSVVVNAPDIILQVDRAGKILSINRVIPGFTVEGVVGRAAYEFLPPESQEVMRKSLDRVFETGESATYEVVGPGPSGTQAWWSSRVGPIKRGEEVVAATIITTDVTERKKSEENLRRLAEEQRLMLAHTRDFVYRHDAKGVFTFMSPSVEQITGHSVQDWLEHYTKYLTDNPVNQEVINYTEETLRTGKQQRPYLVEVFHKDGRRILLEVNERAYDEGGRIAGIVGVARDVTELERARVQLEKAMEEARRAYEDLKRAQDELVRTAKLASIGMLVSGVAHELNNPINVIYGNLKLLKAGIRGKLPAGRIGPMLRDAETAADRARLIIEEFRNFARDTRTAEPADLNRCLDETLAVLKKDLGSKVRVVRKYGTIPPVRCLRGQINQVFFNLLRNAVESMGKKGTITLKTKKENGSIRVEVMDTGRGMTEEIQKKLFEPFFTTKEVGQGLGLGLSISATIVQNHGGRISCKSRPGRGSTFTIELPIRK